MQELIHPIARKWPTRYPERIQLYSVPTPNGVKVAIMLEETGLAYEPHFVSFEAQEQNSPEFLALNRNGKIPALLDPRGPDDAPVALAESGAILIYLADKSNQFLARAGAARYETLQWLMFQMGGVGPMFGQVGFFHKFAGKDYPDKRPLERYVTESKRLLGVLEQQLATHTWLAGEDYSIADIATFPWINALISFYGAAELVSFGNFPHVRHALDTFLARPAVVRGLTIPQRP